MGDGEEQAAAAPTEMAGTADAETQSVHAWAFSDYDDETPVKQPRTFTLSQIVTAVAVIASLAVVVGVAVLIGYHLHNDDQKPDATSTASATSSPTLIQASAPPPAPRPPTSTSLPLPAITTVTVRQPAPPSAHVGTFTTYVLWRGAPCVEIHIPDGGALDDRAACDASQTTVIITPGEQAS